MDSQKRALAANRSEDVLAPQLYKKFELKCSVTVIYLLTHPSICIFLIIIKINTSFFYFFHSIR